MVSRTIVMLFLTLAVVQMALALPAYGRMARRTAVRNPALKARSTSTLQWTSVAGKPTSAAQTTTTQINWPTSFTSSNSVPEPSAQPEVVTIAPTATTSSAAGVTTIAVTPALGANFWVDARNVKLPSGNPAARGLKVKRDLIPRMNPKQLVARVGPHPGAPTSQTLKINAIGGSTGGLISFTLINATGASSPTSMASTSTSYGVASTSAALNIVQNISSITNAIGLSSIAALPTVTETLTFTAGPSITKTATVTLIPTLLPNAADAVYVPAVNITAALLRNGTGLEVTLQVNATVEVQDIIAAVVDDQTGTTGTKQRRDTIAFLNAPEAAAFTRDQMLSDAWEDCIIGVDAGCTLVPEY